MPTQTREELPVDRYLQGLYDRCAPMTGGAVADYIPPLAAVDPDRFAICIATVDGRVYQIGDAADEFTIQSISKPFTYGLACQDRGLPAVLEKIGVEPSGDAFNEISLDGRGRPFNPMINAGAIMAASLVTGDDPVARLLDCYSTWAGRPLGVDTAVFEAERETGHRNRAIGHMLRAVGTLDGEVDRALDVYFQQCSVAVTTRDLAVMAASLAGRGINPLTGDRALPDDLVDHVLSLMTTCGMYDAAGEWLVDVGIPAKSGVGGGIIGVLPGQLGIAVFSPRLDPVGNSLRGVATFRQLSADLRLHFLNVGRSNRATVSVGYPLSEVPSTRHRGPAARAALDADPSAAVVLELSGDLLFAGAEAISRTALERPHRFVLLDLQRVGVLDTAAATLLAELARQLRAAGGELVCAGGHDEIAGARRFDYVDAAKEWCEDALLDAAGEHEPGAVPPDGHPLLAGLSGDEVAAVLELSTVRALAPGDVLIRAGDHAAEIFALLAGEVEVSIAGADGGRHRLATLVPGDTFGESAMTGLRVRTADVVATTAGECLVLATAAVQQAPATLRARLLATLLAIAHQALARSAREIAALTR